MFIFCLEREWRQEVAGFMGNVVVIVTVHLFILLWEKLVSEGFYRETEKAESKERESKQSYSRSACELTLQISWCFIIEV